MHQNDAESTIAIQTMQCARLQLLSIHCANGGALTSTKPSGVVVVHYFTVHMTDKEL